MWLPCGKRDGGDAGEFADVLCRRLRGGDPAAGSAPSRRKAAKVRWTLPRERMRSTISWPR